MRSGIESVKGTLWGVTEKSCDFCKSSPAAVFCRVDSAFSCLNCDSSIHGMNKQASCHARVLMCEVCEQAPAAVICKADAAALCVTCDDDIHSANPLASRHERVPIEPFYDSPDWSIIKSSHQVSLDQNNGGSRCIAEPGSWLLPAPDSNLDLNTKFVLDRDVIKTAVTEDLFFSEMDPFLDFDYSNSFQQQQQQHRNHNTGTDSVVPVQTKQTATISIMKNGNCFNMDFGRNKLSAFNYPNQPHTQTQSVSSPSLDVGVVPDGSDNSYGYMSAGADPISPVPSSAGTGTPTSQVTPLCGIDREARVLRYREKRKNRKFEKTIRYASRKAYAETRPRIKGRFAKRTTKVDSGMEKRFYGSASAAAVVFIDTAEYGVVPSF